MERRKDSKGKVLQKGESERKDGTYMYRYYDSNHDRISVYAQTLNELREKEKQILADLTEGIVTNDFTLNELFCRYLAQNCNLKDRTRKKYEDEYCRWVKNTWIGKRKIKDIKKSDVAKFYKEKHNGGLANGTIVCIHKYINGALNLAYEDDLIRRNYAKLCIEPYKGQTKRYPLTKAQTNEFLTAAENERYGKKYLLGFKLMLLTGMRIGEMTGLTWNDIDLKNRIIDVNHQFVTGDADSRTTYHIDDPKTFKGKRKVPMSDDVFQLFKELKTETYFDAFKFNAAVDGYKGFVIHSRTGLPVLTSKFNEYAHRIVDRYNEEHEEKLPNITCHICRHTFCTRMAELNMNPQALIKIVGHSSYATTENTYISVDDDFVNEEFYKAMRGAV